MDKVIKTFVSQIKSINEKDFTLEAIVSDETIDRYGEVINIDAWKKRLGNYKSHPVLVTSHNYNKLTNQIGYAEKIYVKNGELICKFKYFVGEGNEEADWGWKLASKFGQAAYSVGFLPFSYERAEEKDYEDAKAGKKPYLTYTDVELLEVSQVLVPANPSALAKSFEEEKDLVIKEYSETVLKNIKEMFEEEEFVSFIRKDFGEIVTKPETTEKYHHVPVPGEEGKHSGHKIRTITVSKDQGIKGKYCVDDKKVISYMFSTDKWTMDEAKEWVKEHSKGISGIYLVDTDDFMVLENILTYDEFMEIFEKCFEEGKKKPKPKPCKEFEEEEEEMKEMVEEIKSYIDEKLAPIEDYIKRASEEDNDFEKEIEEERKSFEQKMEAERKEKEDKDRLSDEENYLIKMIEDINKVAEKHIPVQS